MKKIVIKLFSRQLFQSEMLVSPLVDAAIFLMPIVPFFGPMLLDIVLLIVSLAPVLALFEARAQLCLPLVTPFFFMTWLVDFAPFLIPFFLGIVILAILLTCRLFNFTSIGLILVRNLDAMLITLI